MLGRGFEPPIPRGRWILSPLHIPVLPPQHFCYLNIPLKTEDTITIIIKLKIIPIQSGASTHTQDHSMTWHNFNTTNTIVKMAEKLKFTFTLVLPLLFIIMSSLFWQGQTGFEPPSGGLEPPVLPLH